MAGLIKREDIDEVRSRVRIDEVVGEYVTLKGAGIGSLKGLCPFHDERSPSFHVRPQVGMYHCFGCGESGDVFTFLQKIDGMTFAESVERLADKAGIALRYEDGGKSDPQAAGQRQRLVDMHQVAAEFYRTQLATPEAEVGRTYLSERGFDAAALETFGVGYAPKSWNALLDHLHSRGYRNDEILASGLVSQGRSGPYDRFRGRLTWPIRDITGRTIGFGARRLFDDDQGPKYLNTPETVLYHKNQVLYGLDLAKRPIAKNKRIVIVEGYTDVMAAHLAGVDYAVATCGTAFGSEHVKVVRRLMGDDSARHGQVIFTFDGDAAGRKAALKAFDEDQKFVAQTYAAVEPTGQDPCELRMSGGDEAVRALIESKRPLFEFAISSTISEFDLDTAEGRIGALRAVAGIVAGIRDPGLRPEYERFVAGRIGIPTSDVEREVSLAYRRKREAARGGSGRPQAGPGQTGRPGPGGQVQRLETRPGPRDAGQPHPGQPHPVADTGEDLAEAIAAYDAELDIPDENSVESKVERGALKVALQHPEFVNAKLFDNLGEAVFGDRRYAQVHTAMRAAGGIAAGLADADRWPQSVMEAAGPLAGLVGQLAVEPLPAHDLDGVERYSRGIVARLFDKDIVRIAELLHSRLERTDPNDPASLEIVKQLQVLEHQRARLRSLM